MDWGVTRDQTLPKKAAQTTSQFFCSSKNAKITVPSISLPANHNHGQPWFKTIPLLLCKGCVDGECPWNHHFLWLWQIELVNCHVDLFMFFIWTLMQFLHLNINFYILHKDLLINKALDATVMYPRSNCHERQSVDQRRWRESLGLPLQTLNWGKNSQQIMSTRNWWKDFHPLSKYPRQWRWTIGRACGQWWLEEGIAPTWIRQKQTSAGDRDFHWSWNAIWYPQWADIFLLYLLHFIKWNLNYFPSPKQDDISSDFTFKHAVLCHFINFNKTHLTKSSERDKGEPWANTLTDPNFPCTGTQVLKDPGGHVCCLWKSCHLCWFSKLGQRNKQTWRSSQVGVRICQLLLGSGVFVKSLQLIHTLLSTVREAWMRICSFKQSSSTNPSSLMLNYLSMTEWWVDWGSHFYQIQQWSWKKLLDMHREWVHLGPGLPKTTIATQEMDYWFQEFKGHTEMMVQEIFEKPCFDHTMALHDHEADRETKIKGAALTWPPSTDHQQVS